MSTISTRTQNSAYITFEQGASTSAAAAVVPQDSGKDVPISRFEVNRLVPRCCPPNNSFSAPAHTQTYNSSPAVPAVEMTVASKEVEIKLEIPQTVRNIFNRIVDRFRSGYKKENLSSVELSLTRGNLKADLQKEGAAKNIVNPLKEEIVPRNKTEDKKDSASKLPQRAETDQKAPEVVFKEDLSSRGKPVAQETTLVGFVEIATESLFSSPKEAHDQKSLFSETKAGADFQEPVRTGQKQPSIATNGMLSETEGHYFGSFSRPETFANNYQRVIAPVVSVIDEAAAKFVASSMEAQKRALEEKAKEISEASEKERLHQIEASAPTNNDTRQANSDEIGQEYSPSHDDEGDNEE